MKHGLAPFIAASLLPAMLSAQVICGERSAFLKALYNNHKEAPVAIGVNAAGSVLEVLASKDGNWTMIITQPNRLTCLVMTGVGWEQTNVMATDPET